MLPVLLSLLVASSAAHPGKRQASNPVFMPIKYPYNGYPKVYADLCFGTPAQTAIEAVVDLGSSDFWVYGPNATIYYGSPYLGVEGPCQEHPSPNYNPLQSTTAHALLNQTRGYAYGGNGKILTSYYTNNDTVAFDGTATFPNTQVAIVNKTLVKIRADECTGVDYDGSILGLSEFTDRTVGPSWRQNLLSTGAIESSTLAMWFDQLPADAPANATHRGTALFGAIPQGKYAGNLVQVPKRQPESSVGYYVDTPVWTVGERRIKLYDNTTTECLIDSGSGQDYLPLDQDDFLNATGLISWNNYVAYNGSCDEIPRDAAVSITFGGVDNGASVTIDVPIRNWARGNTDWLNDTTKCGLSMQLSNVGSCTLGSPFSSAAFLAVNDELDQIALAQGGVSTGAEDGADGLGTVEIIAKGQGLP